MQVQPSAQFNTRIKSGERCYAFFFFSPHQLGHFLSLTHDFSEKIKAGCYVQVFGTLDLLSKSLFWTFCFGARLSVSICVNLWSCFWSMKQHPLSCWVSLHNRSETLVSCNGCGYLTSWRQNVWRLLLFLLFFPFLSTLQNTLFLILHSKWAKYAKRHY